MSPELNLYLSLYWLLQFLPVCVLSPTLPVPVAAFLLIQPSSSNSEAEKPLKEGVRIHAVLAISAHSDHIVTEIL